jgi:hypothetical protein
MFARACLRRMLISKLEATIESRAKEMESLVTKLKESELRSRDQISSIENLEQRQRELEADKGRLSNEATRKDAERERERDVEAQLIAQLHRQTRLMNEGLKQKEEAARVLQEAVNTGKGESEGYRTKLEALKLDSSYLNSSMVATEEALSDLQKRHQVGACLDLVSLMLNVSLRCSLSSFGLILVEHRNSWANSSSCNNIIKSCKTIILA